MTTTSTRPQTNGKAHARITAAQIRDAPPDCREEELEVPEWGGWVLLRSPTALAQAEIQSAGMQLDESGNPTGVDIPAMERMKFRYCVVDPVLTEDDVMEIQRSQGPSWKRVMDKVDELTGTLAEEGGAKKLQKAAEKSFRPAP